MSASISDISGGKANPPIRSVSNVSKGVKPDTFLKFRFYYW